MSVPRKRTLEAFFAPAPKRSKAADDDDNDVDEVIHIARVHHADLPASLSNGMASAPARPSRSINDQPDLDLVYFEPFIPTRISRALFEFLRAELPFYRVEYDIQRSGIATHVRTPRSGTLSPFTSSLFDSFLTSRRWTTVFGLDDTSFFSEDGRPLDKATGRQVRYPAACPRPIPECLDRLRRSSEAATGCRFNFCLVNYYASGYDSIAFHSDDERFLGKDPAIASISLGARRDFILRHKPTPPPSSSLSSSSSPPQPPVPQPRHLGQLRFPLGSGDLMLMRGRTQSSWLHSIPKRVGKNQVDGGRINITFRKAMVREGTENYYRYNVGNGPVYRWNRENREMMPWIP
ncbi:hypothetical protein L249_7256 [Ophiocordyceps polyrhachis-furcata BCC 54312]|uniref:Fe2OG dioxygenase domain-containing protein n=1 Tax=Ophiocordyceps polyrhachis-furcata BCC 54312 TaxID=1330021 RepID=A0A367LBJ5_9HYPO|nr:hypothetical protein L249_7256 [Ophiocordyceps polyrhachis-furcata BCC 54312]